jgi:hypothetical protein
MYADLPSPPTMLTVGYRYTVSEEELQEAFHEFLMVNRLHARDVSVNDGDTGRFLDWLLTVQVIICKHAFV